MNTIEVLRQYKIGPFAIFDTVGSYLAVLILSPIITKVFSKLGVYIHWTSLLWLTMPLAVVFHILFKQSTPLMKLLMNPKQIQFFIAWAILVFMAYMGLKGIHKITS